MAELATDTALASLFNPHDIRGVWEEGLTPERARQILRAAVAQLRGDEDSIVLGRDGRLSSPDIHRIAVEEITGAGLGLIDVGETATEVVYFASGFYRLPGIMITASHNGPEWNGFKFCGPLAAPIGKATGLWAIRDQAQTLDPNIPPGAPEGPIANSPELANTYVGKVQALVPFSEQAEALTIVVDGANGMANVVAPMLLDELNVIWLANQIDGRFPAHEPNPLKSKNLEDLCFTVKREQADLGLAFDGDADRLILVDNNGNPVPPALAQAYIAQLAIARFGNQNGTQPTVLYSEVSSQIVPMVIEAAGANAVQTPVGHSAIKTLMAEHGAIAAVEHSGHYYFDATFRADSALMAAALVIADAAVHHGQSTLGERLAALPQWVMAEEENWVLDQPDQAYARISKEIQLDPVALLGGGYAFQTDHWRATLRPSNTEPLLRFNIEANDISVLDDYQGRIRRALIAVGAQQEGS